MRDSVTTTAKCSTASERTRPPSKPAAPGAREGKHHWSGARRQGEYKMLFGVRANASGRTRLPSEQAEAGAREGKDKR